MGIHEFEPRDENFDGKVRESFALQEAMKTIGCSIDSLEAGKIEIHFPFNKALTQQHGFIHAGILSTVMDSACGYAAFSLMPADAAVLSIEFKVNLLSPAKGDAFRVVANVIRLGKTITVCAAETFSINGTKQKRVANMTGTMMAVFDREGIKN
ncbi:MAG: PaaI family thioesterase [Pyrinomonadaceae bacterium]|nr:PaaI family thioesterase [Pyrinomonadaceae bacterium]